MGYLKTSMGLIDDGAVGIMDKAIDELRKRYRAELGREPSKLEVHAVVAFALESLDGLSDDADTPKRTKRDTDPEKLRAEIRALKTSNELLRAHNAVLNERATNTSGKMLVSALVGGLLGCAFASEPGDKDGGTYH